MACVRAWQMMKLPPDRCIWLMEGDDRVTRGEDIASHLSPAHGNQRCNAGFPTTVSDFLLV